MQMGTRKAKWILAGIWLAGSALVFLILVAQSLLNYYEPKTQDAWGWFLPTVVPTLSLIIAVLVADQLSGSTTEESANQPAGAMFWLGAGLSTFYLVLVALSVLVQPFLPQTSPLEILRRSNLWLGPVQGLTVAALGVFFRNRN
jgi:hypothetical protein